MSENAMIPIILLYAVGGFACMMGTLVTALSMIVEATDGRPSKPEKVKLFFILLGGLIVYICSGIIIWNVK